MHKLIYPMALICLSLFAQAKETQSLIVPLISQEIEMAAEKLVQSANDEVAPDSASSSLPRTAPITAEAEEFIKQAEFVIDNKSLKKQAKELVSRSEAFVGSYKTNQDRAGEPGSELVGGVDLAALIQKYKNPFKIKKEGTASKRLPTLMVFVSSSIPPNILMSLAKQTAKAKGVMVLNGFIGSPDDNTRPRLSTTIKFMHEIVRETGVQIDINPTMYTLFNVTSVPQILVTSEPLRPCPPEQGDCEVIIPQHDKIMGNVSLYYALELFSFDGEASATALEHLNMLQSSKWNQPDPVTN